MRIMISLLVAALCWPVGAASAVESPEPRAYCRLSEVGDRARVEAGTVECVRVESNRPRWQLVDTTYTRRAALRLLNTWPEFLGPATFGDLCRRYDRKPMAVRWYMVDAFSYPASVMLPVSKVFLEEAC